MLVEHLQSALQQQYDLAIPYQVRHFVSHDPKLAQHLAYDNSTAGHDSRVQEQQAQQPVPQETVYISQSDDLLEFTLYLDHDVLQSASANTQTSEDRIRQRHDEQPLDSLCTVVEGVSHAVCLLWHAHHDRQLRALDLELQAEVDKYLMLLSSCSNCDSRALLHRQLFDKARFTSPVGSDLYQRYKLASESAASYCNWLIQEFPEPGDRHELRQELARFYRLSGNAKFERIKRLH
jgi:hypothetical protein